MRIYLDVSNAHSLPLASFLLSDVPDGYGIWSDTLDMILIPVDNEYWVGFGGDDTLGVIEEDKPIEGRLVRIRQIEVEA